MGAEEHTGSGTFYVNHVLFSWDRAVMKSYFNSNQQETYEQPLSLSFTCAVQLTQHANNLFSAKRSDAEEVRIFTFPVIGMSLQMGCRTGP